MKYTKIDMNEWNRGRLFETYIQRMRVVMSMTADVNAEPLLKFTKANGLKFYPAMIWPPRKTSTRATNSSAAGTSAES